MSDPSSFEHNPKSVSGLRGTDLLKVSGGKVPGAKPGDDFGPAFTHVTPRSMPLPVLIAVPHAGRAYPDHVKARFRNESLCQLRLEDRHVDQIGVEVAKATGTALLVAHAPRAMLDLNRSDDDIDWDMISGARRRERPAQTIFGSRSGRANHRARSGLGLVPRRLPGFGEIWRQPLTRDELDARIDHIHRPYHAFLRHELERIREAWGVALLIDLHSMPPLQAQAGQSRAPHIVLGDRFGASCASPLLGRAFRYLEECGLEAAHNRPYSGGYVLDRHASPSSGIHALQVEVCRSVYLDGQMSQTTAGLGPLAAKLAGLVRELGAATARLVDRDRLDEAAE